METVLSLVTFLKSLILMLWNDVAMVIIIDNEIDVDGICAMGLGQKLN